MSALVRLVLTSNGTKADFQSQCRMAMGGLDAVNSVVDFLAGLTGGQRIGAYLDWKVGAIQATGTITQTSTGAANGQTCTICGVTFTALTSGHVSTEATWDRNNSPTTSAANLAASINEYAPFSGMISAIAALGVVTVTCVVPGVVGNGLVMANVNLANTTFSSFASGTDGTAHSQDLR